MFRLIFSIAKKNEPLSGLLLTIGSLFFSKHNQNVLRWKLIDGDKIFRINYPLDSESVVFDIGGYKGDFTWAIYQKYKCNVYIFEPVMEYYEILKKRFKDLEKIRVLDYGLAEKNQYANIYLSGNSTSIYGKFGELEKVKLVDIKDILHKYEIKSVDLTELNIEGGEYNLLEYLINKDLVKKFKNIQVQFHTTVKDANARRQKIQKLLQKTHKLTYEYPFVWENWSLRN